VNKKGRDRKRLPQWQAYQKDAFEVVTCYLSYVRSHCSSLLYDPLASITFSETVMSLSLKIRRLCKFLTSFVWEFTAAVTFLLCGATAQHGSKPPHC